jgi:hypothetical protein
VSADDIGRAGEVLRAERKRFGATVGRSIADARRTRVIRRGDADLVIALPQLFGCPSDGRCPTEEGAWPSRA